MDNRHQRNIVIACLLFLISIYTSGQCPDRTSIWQRLIFLRDYPDKAPSVADQINELVNDQRQWENCSFGPDSIQALLYQRIGVLYSRQGDYVKAIASVKKSINTILEHESSKAVNPRHLERSYYILSVFYGELGRMTEKIEAIDKCISISLKYKSTDRYILNLLWDKSEYLYNVGDYKGSFDVAGIGESVIREYSGSNYNSEFLAGFRSMKIKSRLATGSTDHLQDDIKTEIELAIQSGAVQNLGTLMEQMAEVLVKTGDLVKAEDCFQKAYQYDLKIGYKFGCSQILNNLAYKLYLGKYRDFSKAVNTYKKAIAILGDPELAGSQFDFERLNIYNGIASLFVQKSRYDSASFYFQAAFDQILPGFNENSIFSTSAIDTIQYKRVRYLINLLSAKGDAFIKRYKERKNENDLLAAIRIYKLTDLLLDKSRVNQSEMQSKLFWLRDSHLLYESGIEACLLSGDIKNAFYFFEKSRASLLNDQLKEEKWMKEEDVLKLAQLKRDILLRERELNTMEAAGGKKQDLSNEIYELKQKMNQLKTAVSEKTPVFRNITDTSLVDIQKIRDKIISGNKTLIELFAGDSSLYALMISPQTATLSKINKKRFDSLSDSFISYLSDPALLNRDYDGFVRISSQLYRLIFPKNEIPPGGLIVSPDRQYFPFEALVISGENGPPVFFIRDHIVSYTYSARFLLNNSNSTALSSGNSFMGVAPLNYPSSFSLASLTGSDRSLNTIASFFRNGASIVAANATRGTFLKNFSQYGIIQLYTHAAGTSINNEPVIYFADSALYLSDLIGESKPLTRLIVLSACETGLGQEYKGEGIFSLNRGFAAMGIPSSVANLWTVDNESTYKITELFYEYVADGLALDEALQKAKKEYIRTSSKEKQLPFYWAAAILVGNTDSIPVSGRASRGYYALVISLVLGTLLAIKLIKKRKRLSPAPGIKETVS